MCLSIFRVNARARVFACEMFDYAIVDRGSIRSVGIFLDPTAAKTALVSTKPPCNQYSGL